MSEINLLQLAKNIHEASLAPSMIGLEDLPEWIKSVVAVGKSFSQETLDLRAKLTRLREENAELVANISKAWRMGQEYWRLSDSESIANHKRAERLRIEFEAIAKYKKDV